MGKAGRIFCIFTPYALTIASLICIIMVGLGGTNKSDSTLNNLYFFRANMQNLTTSPQTTSKVSNLLNEAGKDVSNEQLTSAIEKAKNSANLKDFYTIGLWGYCSGDIDNNDNYKTTFCSKPEAQFWFNPFKVWNVGEAGEALPKDAQKTMNIYKDVSKWMFIAYIIAFISTAAELIIGVFAICSRWGSCVTTLVSGVSLLFTIAASVTSTALFVTLNGALNTALKSYGVTGSMGKNMFAATWLAVAFSLAASLFWLISSCCCSGRSPYNHRNRQDRGIAAEKAPYTYEPLGPNSTTPYGAYNTTYPSPSMQQGNNVPMHNMAAPGYEPFRHA